MPSTLLIPTEYRFLYPCPTQNLKFPKLQPIPAMSASIFNYEWNICVSPAAQLHLLPVSQLTARLTINELAETSWKLCTKKFGGL